MADRKELLRSGEAYDSDSDSKSQPVEESEQKQAPKGNGLNEDDGGYPIIGTLMDRIQDADDESSSICDFGFRVYDIFCGSLPVMVCALLFAGAPVSSVVIGCLYFHDCPRQQLIPLWLIVFGCIILIQTFVNVTKRFCRCKIKKKVKDAEMVGEATSYNPSTQEAYTDIGLWLRNTANIAEAILLVFLMAWLVVGSYFVFEYYVEEGFNCRSNLYEKCCHPVPFFYSFVLLLTIFAIIGVVLLVLLCFFGGMGIVALVSCLVGLCGY